MKAHSQPLIKILAVLAIVRAFASCSCPNPQEPLPPDESNPTLSGEWQAQGEFSGVGFLVQFNVMQGEDSLASGNGKISALGQSVNFTVAGKNYFPKVALEFFNENDTLTWSGEFAETDTGRNSNKLTGLLQAPSLGLNDYPLDFDKIGAFYLCKCPAILNQKTLKELFGIAI